ncbi:hypothetical protein CCP3SC5AM1_1200008 [Gammaproteobacteria bacterium]
MAPFGILFIIIMRLFLLQHSQSLLISELPISEVNKAAKASVTCSYGLTAGKTGIFTDGRKNRLLSSL